MFNCLEIINWTNAVSPTNLNCLEIAHWVDAPLPTNLKSLETAYHWPNVKCPTILNWLGKGH